MIPTNRPFLRETTNQVSNESQELLELSKHDEDLANKRLCFEPPLYMQRYDYLNFILNKFKCKSLLDIGCAECKLIRMLKNLNQNLKLIVGVDIEEKLLENSKEQFETNLFDMVQAREQPLDIYLVKGDISRPSEYFLDRLCYLNSGLECVSLIEVIEHMYPDTLDKCIETVFAKLKPKIVVITTPNSDYNIVFDIMEQIKSEAKENKFRHWDHKFEWTRKEFQDWCQFRILDKFNEYKLLNSQFDGVGLPPLELDDVGFCSQIAVFVNENYSSTNSNEYQNYLTEKKRINILNRNLRPNQEKYNQKLYIDDQKLIQEKQGFKLISSISYPFEIYEFENEIDRNQALFSELNYLIHFLTQPSRYTFNPSSNFGPNMTAEEEQERLDNNIDIYDDYIRLAKIDKLMEFNSLKKFKLNKNQLISIMNQNGYKFTQSGEYVIYQIEVEDKYEDYNEEALYYEQKSESNISIENERENNFSTFDEPEWTSEAIEIYEKSSSPITIKEVENNTYSSFEEELWDKYIQPVPRFYTLEEQFEDAEEKEQENGSEIVLPKLDISIEKILNFKFESRSDRLKLVDFEGYNYNYEKQKKIIKKLRRASKKTLKALIEQPMPSFSNPELYLQFDDY